MQSANKCHQCGATSYKPVIKRDGQGEMRPSGQYQCTGCNFVFMTIDKWRTGDAMVLAHAPDGSPLDR